MELFLCTYLNSVPDRGVSFMPQLHDSNRKSFQNAMQRRLGGTQDPFGYSDEEKNLGPCQKFALDKHPVASHYTILHTFSPHGVSVLRGLSCQLS
jgi:hypothetical protein